jgi:hypothetical protein
MSSYGGFGSFSGFASSSSRRSQPSSGYGPPDRNSRYGGYRSSESSNSYGYSGYNSHSRPGYSDGGSLRRAVSTRNAYDNQYNYRDLSPLREVERPRQNVNAYEDHRSVSPLGTSRFEQPFTSSRSFASSPLQRSDTVRESYGTRSYDSYGRSLYNHDYDRSTTSQAYGEPSSLSRSNAVRGRTSSQPHASSEIGYIASDPRLGTQRRPNIDSNFRTGGFSNWERF